MRQPIPPDSMGSHSSTCGFCSFGEKWNVFESPMGFNLEEVVAKVKVFAGAGANAVVESIAQIGTSIGISKSGMQQVDRLKTEDC